VLEGSSEIAKKSPPSTTPAPDTDLVRMMRYRERHSGRTSSVTCDAAATSELMAVPSWRFTS
jgi:hypothetical protein